MHQFTGMWLNPNSRGSRLRIWQPWGCKSLHAHHFSRVWFNSRMRPCQGRDNGATPFTRSIHLARVAQRRGTTSRASPVQVQVLSRAPIRGVEATADRHPAFTRTRRGCNYLRLHQSNAECAIRNSEWTRNRVASFRTPHFTAGWSNQQLVAL